MALYPINPANWKWFNQVDLIKDPIIESFSSVLGKESRQTKAKTLILGWSLGNTCSSVDSMVNRHLESTQRCYSTFALIMDVRMTSSGSKQQVEANEEQTLFPAKRTRKAFHSALAIIIHLAEWFTHSSCRWNPRIQILAVIITVAHVKVIFIFQQR